MPRGGNREGAGRPSKPEEDKAKPVAFKMTAADVAMIRDGAERLGMTQRALIVEAVTAYLAARGNEAQID